MKALLELLQGKKTYVTCGVIFGLLFGVWQGWWKVPQEVYAALMALAMVFLRVGAKRDADAARGQAMETPNSEPAKAGTPNSEPEKQI